MNRKIFLKSSIVFLIGLQTLSAILAKKEGRKTEGTLCKNSIPVLFLIGDHGIRLIWIRTTPFIDNIHNSCTTSSKCYAADVDQYNQMADKVCSDPVDPLQGKSSRE